MKTIEYRTTDKSGWGDGPWQHEPDKKQWQDPATGLPCLIVRGPSGALCGYVGVPNGHPYHGKDYDALGVSVHGGLTFAHGCAEINEAGWLRDKEQYVKCSIEARLFPGGDSAEFRRDIEPVIDSFEAWAEYQRARKICHIGAPGDHVWWFGFDCAHAGDIVPKYLSMRRRSSNNETYRTIEYVTDQVAALAAQLASQS